MVVRWRVICVCRPKNDNLDELWVSLVLSSQQFAFCNVRWKNLGNSGQSWPTNVEKCGVNAYSDLVTEPKTRPDTFFIHKMGVCTKTPRVAAMIRNVLRTRKFDLQQVRKLLFAWSVWKTSEICAGEWVGKIPLICFRGVVIYFSLGFWLKWLRKDKSRQSTCKQHLTSKKQRIPREILHGHLIAGFDYTQLDTHTRNLYFMAPLHLEIKATLHSMPSAVNWEEKKRCRRKVGPHDLTSECPWLNFYFLLIDPETSCFTTEQTQDPSVTNHTIRKCRLVRVHRCEDRHQWWSGGDGEICSTGIICPVNVRLDGGPSPSLNGWVWTKTKRKENCTTRWSRTKWRKRDTFVSEQIFAPVAWPVFGPVNRLLLMCNFVFNSKLSACLFHFRITMCQNRMHWTKCVVWSTKMSLLESPAVFFFLHKGSLLAVDGILWPPKASLHLRRFSSD